MRGVGPIKLLEEAEDTMETDKRDRTSITVGANNNLLEPV
jgi:hypothetical protein